MESSYIDMRDATCVASVGLSLLSAISTASRKAHFPTQKRKKKKLKNFCSVLLGKEDHIFIVSSFLAENHIVYHNWNMAENLCLTTRRVNIKLQAPKTM